ncbi:MAG: lipopolysaccharide biosynthesis protein [Kofleriaceae bacterium]
MSHEADGERARLRRDVVWNLVPVVLLAVVGLGLNFLIGRWWGADALGSFNQVTPAFFALAVLGAGGLQYAVLRAVAEAPDSPRVPAVVVGALIPGVAFAALVALACLLLAAPIGHLVDSDAVATGMRWVAPGVFCFAVNKILLGVVNGLRRMRAFAVYTSLRYLLIAAGLVAARVSELPASHLAVLWTFAEGALLLVLIGELLATVRLRRCAGWTTWVRDHIAFGARGLPATVAFEINSKLDVWMLGVALPDKYVGIYALASSLYEGATQLAVVVQNNLNPIIARDIAAQRKAEVESLIHRTRRWFVPVMIAGAVAGAAIYPFAIPWLVGDDSFRAGAVPFAILMAGVAINARWLPFNQTLLMAARPGWHTAYIAGMILIAFVGNYVLIPLLQLEGAAIATAFAQVASAALLVVFVRMRVGIRL